MENMNVTVKSWKYLSFALIGILAAGSTVSFLPQASAHITTNVQHMLEHIFSFVDGIEAKTNNLPADPASNTVVNSRASQTSVTALQTTVNSVKAKTDVLPGDIASQSATNNAMFNKVVGMRLVSNFDITCNSNKDFIVHIALDGHSQPDLGTTNSMIIYRLPDSDPNTAETLAFYNNLNTWTTLTVGARGDQQITIRTSTNTDATMDGLITLQTTQGAVASCNFE